MDKLKPFHPATLFRELRFSKNTRLGLGDIRLSAGLQAKIIDEWDTRTPDLSELEVLANRILMDCSDYRRELSTLITKMRSGTY